MNGDIYFSKTEIKSEYIALLKLIGLPVPTIRQLYNSLSSPFFKSKKGSFRVNEVDGTCYLTDAGKNAYNGS